MICEDSIFNKVYTTHAQHLRNFAYYKCGDMDQAEDIAQESFVRLWRKCAEVLFEKAKSYLFTTAYRIFLDQVKANKTIQLDLDKSNALASNENDPHAEMRTNEFRAQLEQAIADLPEGQREVFLMNRIDKLTYKEIAEILEVSSTAVEKRMGKALARLRDKIEELKKFGI